MDNWLEVGRIVIVYQPIEIERRQIIVSYLIKGDWNKLLLSRLKLGAKSKNQKPHSVKSIILKKLIGQFDAKARQ